jgi:hypothetical protein
VAGPAKQTERQPAVLGERYLLWGDLRLDGRAELLAELATGNRPIDPQASSEELLLLPGFGNTAMVNREFSGDS